MAYTGTGTEQDPYLVSTLSDFLTCAAAADAYVKVISDIDAADDEAYTGIITSPVTVNCRKLYADEKKKISGIVVENDRFISVRAGTVDIQNLWFKDCKHKKTGSTNTGYLIYSSGTSAIQANHHIENCDFSVQSSGGSGVTYYVFYGDSTYAADVRFAQYCGFDISCGFTSLEMLRVGNMLSGISMCNFIFRNPVLTRASIYSLSNRVNLTDCSIVLYEPYITKNVRLGDGTQNYVWSYCYMALVDPTGSSQLGVAATAPQQSYFILENAPATFDTQYVSSYLLTPEQLRDRDYLISIGFLP